MRGYLQKKWVVCGQVVGEDDLSSKTMLGELREDR